MNRQRVLSLVLALVMVLGTFGTVFADAKEDRNVSIDAKVQWLVDNKIVEGHKLNKDDKDNSLDLEGNLTRAQVTKLIVYTIGYEDLADRLKGAMKPFPDVNIEHWANGFISVATTQRGANKDNPNGIIIGYPDGNFKPERDVTYAELAAMLVRTVKKDLTKEMEDKAIWATSYIRWAEELGILDGITITDSNKAVNRKDAFAMIYNAMTIKGLTNRNKVNFGDKLGIVSRLQAGKIELNSDKDQVYNIDFNTHFTYGTTWFDNIDRANLGSLVKIIVDKDNNVTHIIELGNQNKGANGPGSTKEKDVDNYVWRGTADHTVSSIVEGEGKDRKHPKAISFYKNDLTIEDVTARINNDTRIFVSDNAKGVFKEVEKLSDAFDMYIQGGRDKDIYHAYMGYDKVAGRRNAKVVVFGDIDKGNNEIVRVVNFLGGNYRFTYENTKGKPAEADIRGSNVFPYANLVEVGDVVDLNPTRYATNYDYKDDFVVIDRSKNDVYEVVSFKDDELKLRDYAGHQESFYVNLNESKVFIEGQIQPGDYVQISEKGKEAVVVGRGALKAVAEVDRKNFKLEGLLPKGTKIGQYEGVIQEARKLDNPVANNDYEVRILVKGLGYRTFLVSELDYHIIAGALTQDIKEVSFDIVRGYGFANFEGRAENFNFTTDSYVKIAEAILDRIEANLATEKTLLQKAASEAIKLVRDNEAKKQGLIERYNRIYGNYFNQNGPAPGVAANGVYEIKGLESYPNFAVTVDHVQKTFKAKNITSVNGKTNARDEVARIDPRQEGTHRFEFELVLADGSKEKVTLDVVVKSEATINQPVSKAASANVQTANIARGANVNALVDGLPTGANAVATNEVKVTEVTFNTVSSFEALVTYADGSSETITVNYTAR